MCEGPARGVCDGCTALRWKVEGNRLHWQTVFTQSQGGWRPHHHGQFGSICDLQPQYGGGWGFCDSPCRYRVGLPRGQLAVPPVNAEGRRVSRLPCVCVAWHAADPGRNPGQGWAGEVTQPPRGERLVRPAPDTGREQAGHRGQRRSRSAHRFGGSPQNRQGNRQRDGWRCAGRYCRWSESPGANHSLSACCCGIDRGWCFDRWYVRGDRR